MPAPAPGGTPPAVSATYYYGFNAPIGGGEYPRAAGFAVDDAEWVLPFPDTAAIPRYATLQEAITYAIGQFGLTGEIAIELADSITYPVTGGVTADLPEGTTLGDPRGRRRPAHYPARRRDRRQRGRVQPAGNQRSRAGRRVRDDARQPGARSARRSAAGPAGRDGEPAQHAEHHRLHSGPWLVGDPDRRAAVSRPARPDRRAGRT